MKAVIALFLATSLGFAQQLQQPPAPKRHPVRIPIRHADPWFVKAMLEGKQVDSPEISTILLMSGSTSGGNGGQGGRGAGGLGGGGGSQGGRGAGGGLGAGTQGNQSGQGNQAGQNNQSNQSGGGNALFDYGYFIVNPTDNSLWFFPNKTN